MDPEYKRFLQMAASIRADHHAHVDEYKRQWYEELSDGQIFEDEAIAALGDDY